jgi:dolichol-phosphate mannosyltransferase
MEPMGTADTENELRLTILMPVRNEGSNLRVTLKVLTALVDVPHEVLVVYDSPEDDSVPVVKGLQKAYPQFRLIHNNLGNGVKNAICAGVTAARAEIVVIMLADDIGPMTGIIDMLALMDDGCEFVSCTRYAHGGGRLGGSRIGFVLSRSANWLFHHLAGCVLSDATTGIKMFRRSAFADYSLESRPVGWAVVFEMAIKAQDMGLRLGEVPIVSIDRLFGGKSTFRVLPWIKEYMRWFLWGMMHLHRSRDRQNRTVSIRIPDFG